MISNQTVIRSGRLTSHVTGHMTSYLTSPEDHPVVVLCLITPLLQFLSPEAQRHRTKVLINAKIILVI